MDCVISLYDNKGKPIGGRRIKITNDTNLIALVYDTRAQFTNCDRIVRAEIDIALNKPGILLNQ